MLSKVPSATAALRPIWQPLRCRDTPLMVAAVLGRTRVVELLIAAGADLEAKYDSW